MAEYGSQFAKCRRTKVPRDPNSGEILADRELPPSVNWVTAGAVTPIKNQGDCGSCYSFSATGSLEGLNFILNKKLYSFSEQQIVSCATAKYNCDGCNGGDEEGAMNYTAAVGIEQE